MKGYKTYPQTPILPCPHFWNSWIRHCNRWSCIVWNNFRWRLFDTRFDKAVSTSLILLVLFILEVYIKGRSINFHKDITSYKNTLNGCRFICKFQICHILIKVCLLALWRKYLLVIFYASITIEWIFIILFSVLVNLFSHKLN